MTDPEPTTEKDQDLGRRIWQWIQDRGSDITRGFAQAYAWVYDLPYEEGITTSEAIAAAEEGVPPYSDTFGWRILGSPASPIDPIYHLWHPEGYQSQLGAQRMETQDREEVDFFRQVVQSSVNLETGAPAALPTTIPETIDASYIDPVYQSVGIESPTPVPIGTIPTYESVTMPIATSPETAILPTPGSDPGPGGDPFDPYSQTVPEGGFPMTLAPWGQDPGPGAIAPFGRRTLARTWLAGPKSGPRIRFYHFYIGSRAYIGCIKKDGSWKQWPVYKPLTIGKTMTDRKARRVANRMDSYMKTVRKIARVMGWSLKR